MAQAPLPLSARAGALGATIARQAVESLEKSAESQVCGHRWYEGRRRLGPDRWTGSLSHYGRESELS